MKFNSTYTFRRLVPVVAISFSGLAIAAVLSAQPHKSAFLDVSQNEATQPENTALSAGLKPNVTVNGAIVPLDANGQAHITTPSGATVQVDGAAPTVSATITSGNDNNSVSDTVNYNVDSVNGGTGRSSSSTNVRVFGNTSSSSSSYSHTTITGNGQSTFSFNSSN